MAVVPPDKTSSEDPVTLTMPLTEVEWDRVVRVLRVSGQQAKIVRLILQGKRDKQIAAELGLGVPTVRTHLTRIFSRIPVADRVELILRVFMICRAGSGCN